MSTSYRTQIEQILITLIRTSSTFANNASPVVPVETFDFDPKLTSKADRIVVNCQKPVPLVGARAPYVNSIIYQAPVTITAIVTSNNTNKIDSWEQELDAVLLTAPAAAITAANAVFPNGFEVDVLTAGDRQQEGAEQRFRTTMLRVVFRP